MCGVIPYAVTVLCLTITHHVHCGENIHTVRGKIETYHLWIMNQEITCRYCLFMMSANRLGPDCLFASQRKLQIHYSAAAKRKLYFTGEQYIYCASYCSKYQLS